MSWSYNPLWKQLIDCKMKKTDLLALANINSRTLAKMGKDEPVSMDALGRICQAMNCRLDQVVEFKPDE